MAACAADLDHLRFGRKACGAGGGFQCRGDLGGGGLADSAAALADQEHNELLAGVSVHACDEGVAALDPVHQPVLTQEIERAVNGGRRQPRTLGRDAVHDLVGAERLMAAKESGQYMAAKTGEAPAALERLRLGDRHGLVHAAVMIVVGRRKYRSGGVLVQNPGFGHSQS